MQEKVEAYAKRVEALREEALFDDELPQECFGGLSEQHFLLGLAALEQAHRHLTIAVIWLRRKE